VVSYFKSLPILIISLLIVASTFLQFVYSDEQNPGIFSKDSKPYGISLGEWTIKFWQWVLPIPMDKNPIGDKTGEFCDLNQNHSLPVFFLSFGDGTGLVDVNRMCNISHSKAILIPVNVVECSFMETKLKSIDELKICAHEDESSNPIADLWVDGNKIKDVLKYRITSDAFNVTLPENSVLGDKGKTTTVSDGYWIMLKPLPIGKHTILFQSSLKGPQLDWQDKVSYTLNIK
jgi:hypothetical protein